MQLVRIGEFENEKPALLIAGRYLDVSAHVQDYNEAFFAGKGLEKLAQIAATTDLPEIKNPKRIGSCVARPSKIICVGLNYADHARETGAEIPTEPILFFKSTTALSGPFDHVIIPKGSTKTDWEVELGIVIWTKARYVSQKNALDYVAGYCVVNDVSEREYQLERGGSWDKGKGCDTFGPIGPWMVTKDEVPNPQKLHMWLELNGKRMQDGSTKTMIFGVTKLVSYVSQFMTLNPGDVITTGTPPGVGAGIKVNGKSAPVFLKRGDKVSLGIEGLGEQHQKIVAFKA